MMDDLKKIMLAGIGSMAYSYEKASEMVDNLVKKGQLTMDQGKELSEELKRNVKSTSEKSIPLTKEDIKELLQGMNFATKDDLNSLKVKVAELEGKLNSK